MRIQRRITLGIGILFTMILLLGIQSVGYVRQLSRATGTILADNYNSLQYAGEMLRSLNDIGQDSISRHALRENLALQQQNITEISEKETTAALERHVASLSDPVTEAEIRTVREDLFRIMELNMAAIRAKSAGVEQRADYAMWWLIAVAALCALIAGGILVWFPPAGAGKRGSPRSPTTTTGNGSISRATASSNPSPSRSTTWPPNSTNTAAVRSTT